jgi:plasmid stabilization system protein ParE
MDLKIVWSKRSKNQFREALEYWEDRNGNTIFPEKLIVETTRKLLKVAENPELGRSWGHPTRRFAMVRSYKIYYDVKKEHILVLLFWHTKRDPDQLAKLLGE